ncbi:MAG: glycoside hydrolase family 3 C-terminal domain-containing protein, partial [Pseudomonadota bacterium]
MASSDHIALAREAAEKSAVLLKNDGLLPLDKTATIGVFGRLARKENTGDYGSSCVRPPYVTTALQGLSKYLQTDLDMAGDESDLPAAAAAAKALDVAILVVGTTAEDEGEFIPGDMGSGPTLPEGVEEQLEETLSSEAHSDDAGALGGG